MRFAVDAHAIGRNLTGNEIYVRSLLRGFAETDRNSEFLAYISATGAERWIPERFGIRRVSANPYSRLGWELARLVRHDRPDLIHVQYTAPLLARTPVVVTVHDVSFLEHPEYFKGIRRQQLRYTVARTVQRAAMVLTVSEFSRDAILRACERAGGGSLTRECFEESMGNPQPVDLLIRSGGERRLSDFLLWECAYAELVFTERMWPEFDALALRQALSEFRSRHRRFGSLPPIRHRSPDRDSHQRWLR